MGTLPSIPPRESLEPFHRKKVFLIFPPSIFPDFLFRVKINNSINKVIRIAIPIVMPTILGTFEVEEEFAGIDVTSDDDDDVDGVIV